MLSSARTFSKQVLNHRSQIQQQTKSQLRNQHNGPRAKDQQQQQQQQQSNSSSTGSSNRHDDDVGGSSSRQVVLEKMRLENRERKKRWREVNEERNKDNDLRCRVNKRANQLYGAKASDDKEKWIGEEFVRRQQRRRDKEQRRRGTGAGASAGASAGAGAGSGSSGQREAQRQQSQSLTPERILPSGFGSYATLPPHQVSAAHSFWKSVAAQQALEETAASSASADSAAQSFAAAPGNAGLRLPPLSSIVPRELLSLSPLRQQQQQPPAHVATQPAASALSDAAGHAGMTAPLSPNPPASSFVVEAASPRRWHVRPWEENSDSSSGDRLTEAAFSLMTLSSNSPPLHYSAAAAAANSASAYE
ncbi:hypothetical protein IWW48_004970 [Coemansia sp. RSA 1200]|nr:hypothetical protein IWW48_004970 [Coemansia sp. RSA 1200]